MAERPFYFRVLGWVVAAGLLWAAWLAATAGIAQWHYRQNDVDSLRRAIAWSPRNPQYHAGLARALQLSLTAPDPEEPIHLLEAAVRLGPHRAEYWSQLGEAYEAEGRTADAQRAFERAGDLFPNSPDINWKLGNFYIRAGRTGEALAAFRRAIAGDARLRRPAFYVALRATADDARVLEELIPPDGAVLLDYIRFLTGAGEMEAAERAWQRLIDQKLAFHPEQTLFYFDALITSRRYDQLESAWKALAAHFPLRFRVRAGEANLMFNGDFEADILNGGLAWRIRPVRGAVVSVDSQTFFDGTRALRIAFDGTENLNYRHYVYQYVPVRPGTDYRFSGYLRAAGLSTDSGVRFVVEDAEDPRRFQQMTADVTGTSSWSAHTLEFRTPAETRLLVVRIARLPSRRIDNRIAGTAWADRVSLLAVREAAGLP